MADLVLVAASILLTALLLATAYAGHKYYRQLCQARTEYEKAKDFVEDIVLSFNRELKREAERIQSVTYKVEANGSKAETGLLKAEELEKKIQPLEMQVGQMEMQLNALTTTMSAVSEANVKTLEKVSNMDTTKVGDKLQSLESVQEALKNKLAIIEEEIHKLSVAPEINVEMPAQVMPVMPIRRDKALAALTETEVAVLEFLSSEGPKTAPEIKEKVGLSREHTARLMKKLYEEGYVERETGKLPFKYRVKVEMEKLLKKPEPTST
jgi:DNA-binding transcriptional regulator GbsR (MarR family)